MRLYVLFFLFVAGIFLFSFVSAEIPSSLSTYIHVQDSSLNTINGTFNYVFNISTSADCSNVVYSNVTTITTDKNGNYNHILPSLALDFSRTHYLCIYRGGIMVSNSSFYPVPYSFYAINTSWQGVNGKPTNLSQFTNDIEDRKYWYNHTDIVMNYLTLNPFGSNYNLSNFNNDLNLSDFTNDLIERKYWYNHTDIILAYLNSNPLSYIETEPSFNGNFTNMQIGCPAGNYSYGVTSNGLLLCRDDITGSTTNPFDQTLNTANDVKFNSINTTNVRIGNPALTLSPLDIYYKQDFSGIVSGIRQVMNYTNPTIVPIGVDINMIGHSIDLHYGNDKVAPGGASIVLGLKTFVKNSTQGAGGTEVANVLSAIRSDTDVRIWGSDTAIHGPVTSQSLGQQGFVQVMNNYNESAMPEGGVGIAVVTKKATGSDHRGASVPTYPYDTGMAVVGFSTNSSGDNNIGFETGLRIGGKETSWMRSASLSSGESIIGTGINITDYVKNGIFIGKPSTSVSSGYIPLNIQSDRDLDGTITIGGPSSLVAHSIRMGNTFGGLTSFVTSANGQFTPLAKAGDSGFRIDGNINFLIADASKIFLSINKSTSETTINDNLIVNGEIKVNPINTPVCDLNSEGSIYYSSTAHKHYGCNSTTWNALY
jgi:hypothetical protein